MVVSIRMNAFEMAASVPLLTTTVLVDPVVGHWSFCSVVEATSALDTESERVVQNALDKLMELKSMTTFGKLQVVSVAPLSLGQWLRFLTNVFHITSDCASTVHSEKRRCYCCN